MQAEDDVKDELFEIVFSTIDTNKNGFIEKPEFMSFYQQVVLGDERGMIERFAEYADDSE